MQPHKTRVSQEKVSCSSKEVLVRMIRVNAGSRKATAKDDPEQVEVFKGSVGTDDPCQHWWLW